MYVWYIIFIKLCAAEMRLGTGVESGSADARGVGLAGGFIVICSYLT